MQHHNQTNGKICWVLSQNSTDVIYVEAFVLQVFFQLIFNKTPCPKVLLATDEQMLDSFPFLVTQVAFVIGGDAHFKQWL